MRSSSTKLDVWHFGEDADGAPSVPDEEAFDSFGPISEIRKALKRPARPTMAQEPHDYTRILVAEDEAFHRRVLRVMLGSPRVSLIEVDDGEAVVDLLALRSFDLLILDLSLPRMSAEEVIRWIRRNHTPWSDIPILGLAELAQKGQTGRLMSLGMTDWTAKPLSRHHLADKIVHLMPALYDASL